MKFGQVLLESMPQDWKFYFVDYLGLKQFIKLNTQVNGPWNNTHETTFIGMLEDELKKVRWCGGYNNDGEPLGVGFRSQFGRLLLSLKQCGTWLSVYLYPTTKNQIWLGITAFASFEGLVMTHTTLSLHGVEVGTPYPLPYHTPCIYRVGKAR